MFHLNPPAKTREAQFLYQIEGWQFPVPLPRAITANIALETILRDDKKNYPASIAGNEAGLQAFSAATGVLIPASDVEGHLQYPHRVFMHRSRLAEEYEKFMAWCVVEGYVAEVKGDAAVELTAPEAKHIEMPVLVPPGEDDETEESEISPEDQLPDEMKEMVPTKLPPAEPAPKKPAKKTPKKAEKMVPEVEVPAEPLTAP